MRHVPSAALAFLLCLFAAVGAAQVSAQQNGAQADEGVVVELFTSQGCSACPPADELLARLAQRPGVIALALHVDYWDYIGWRDRFAKPKFSARQKAYARAEGSRSIYTPQMIVAGTHRVEGLRPMDLADLILEEGRRPPQVEWQLKRSGSMLEIHIEAEPPLEGDVLVELVRYRERETVDIRAGENAGRRVTYHNIVTAWTTLGEWSGSGTIAFHVRAEGEEPIVVLVQEPGPGRILSAARLR
ncbi:DUF1223 domain-containing protein [Alkalilacustris brevis]|uniref:DUF1223 domain-containing protein n=1 Tax=Alkalilacustris brevis TaxID=2026338 RepID=UPI000E0CC246|nr:DUF1223 domain-containing protein [Alkalilacustris brevis]